jgi:hypothetical protein
MDGGGSKSKKAKIKTARAGPRIKIAETRQVEGRGKDFRALGPAESKQNGKIKSKRTLENRAAAPAHILG